MSRKNVLEVDDYFLSAINPTATRDQQDLEALCIQVFAMPKVQTAKRAAAERWRTLIGRDITPEALARLDELSEEFAFNYVMKAANSDANYPRIVHHLYGPPHEWFGKKVPGSRASGGDGPDQSYTLIPVDGYARFELQGQKLDPGIGDVPFMLLGNISLTMTLGGLLWRDIDFDADGRFVITLDSEPANGRPNHIQTTLEARYLFIRDCRSDWRQIPNAYRFKRLDPPTRPPLTIEQIAERASRYMWDDVPAMFWFLRTFAVLDTNAITTPFNTGAVGGLVSQMIAFARVRLADDEAYVVTIGSGNAPFRNIVLHDSWFRTIEYWKHTSSMNNAQGIPNADGSTTYVISIQDPGVHNWLDMVGLHEVLVVHRWQGLPVDPGSDGLPWTEGRVVKLDELNKTLPQAMRRVTPAERAQQLTERLETFKLRYAV